MTPIPRNTPLDRRLQRLAVHLHDLGKRATYEALREISLSGDVIATLTGYERLTPELMRSLGALSMPPCGPLVVPKDRGRAA